MMRWFLCFLAILILFEMKAHAGIFSKLPVEELAKARDIVFSVGNDLDVPLVYRQKLFQVHRDLCGIIHEMLMARFHDQAKEFDQLYRRTK